MPLHAGHIHLLNTAQSACNKLTVLLCSRQDDPIPGALRLTWLQETFPNAKIVHHPEPLPRDQNDPHFWDMWSRSIKAHYPGEMFDAVFSSENYGERLAKEVDAVHVTVDPKRTSYPVSGTDIRKNPLKYWKFIPDVVKPYYKS